MIRANEIERRVREVDNQLITQGESYIDRELEAKWQPGGSAVIGLSKAYTKRVVDQLVEMYERNDWSVQAVSDDREGGYVLTFTKAQDNGPYGNAIPYWQR